MVTGKCCLRCCSNGYEGGVYELFQGLCRRFGVRYDLDRVLRCCPDVLEEDIGGSCLLPFICSHCKTVIIVGFITDRALFQRFIEVGDGIGPHFALADYCF